MIKYIKIGVISLTIIASSLSNGVASEIYQKAMLDDESRSKLAHVFTDPIAQSKQATGIHIYPMEEFHITLKAASVPDNFRCGFAAKCDRDVQNSFKFLNADLKQAVVRAQGALQEVPFVVTGMRLYGKQAHKKFIVCEIAPDFSALDDEKAAAVRSFLPEGLHVSLARIDDADTGAGQQKMITLLRKAQETLQQVQKVDPLTGKQKSLVLRINQVQVETERNQPLMTGKVVPKRAVGRE
jgi:hypothetical protein